MPQVAIVVGVRIQRPSNPLAWYLFAAGQTLFVGGDVLAYNYERFFGRPLPFPSSADLVYLGVFPAIIAGLLAPHQAAEAWRGPGCA